MPSWFQQDKIVSILTVGRQYIVSMTCFIFFNIQKDVPHQYGLSLSSFSQNLLDSMSKTLFTTFKVTN